MNTFGIYSRRVPLRDPRDAIANRVRFGREPIDLLEKANSFRCTAGREPSCGYILLTQSDYQSLASTATTYQLEMDTLVAYNLSIVQAQCVSTGVGDPLYLVELTDARGLLSNRWFQCPTPDTSYGYNCRSPAYPQEYYTRTLAGGTTAWTWSTMLADLWSQAVAGSPGLGAYPGLTYAPSGRPEEWWSGGVPLWTLICDVLERIGMVVAHDPTSQTAPYSISYLLAAGTSLATLQSRYANSRLLDDARWLDAGAGRVPASVTVYFKRRNYFYGTEETVRRDSLQYKTPSYYAVTIAAPTQFVGAVGKHFLWDDFTVAYDVDGSPVASDAGAAAGIAADRVNMYYGRIYGDYMLQLYSGALPFATGPKVDGVLWQHGASGWTTKIWRSRVS